MKLRVLFLCTLCFTLTALSGIPGVVGQDAPGFACPAGTADVMKYFVMERSKRGHQFLRGAANSIYTVVFPDEDFAGKGHWFWLKSAAGNGFDVKAFDGQRVYMRATELTWMDNTSFKRFVRDLPISHRCVEEGKPGPEIRVADTEFKYYSACQAYKSSNLGTAVNTLDAPVRMDVGGDLGEAWTRVLHYHYNCDPKYENCKDEEQFYLANGFGLWQWKHFRNGALVKRTLMNRLENGQATGKLPCQDAYE